MLASESSAKKPGYTWTQEKIRSSPQIKTTFPQKCGLRSERILLCTYSAELGPGSPEREPTISENRETIRMPNSGGDKKNSALLRKKRERLRSKEECTQRKEKISISFLTSWKLGD